MRKEQVEVNGRYRAKVSGRSATIRITGEDARGGWQAVNEATGRAVRIRSAGRLSPLPDTTALVDALNEGLAAEQEFDRARRRA